MICKLVNKVHKGPTPKGPAGKVFGIQAPPCKQTASNSCAYAGQTTTMRYNILFGSMVCYSQQDPKSVILAEYQS